MPNEMQVKTKTSTKTFVALLVVAGVLTVAAAFAMATIPTDSFYKKGKMIQPGYNAAGYSTQGYSAPGYQAPGYVAPGYQAPGYVAPGYVAPGYVAPGYVAPGYVAPGYQP